MDRETEINLIGRISHFFAVNKPLSVLVLLTSLAFGLLAFFITPKQYNPEIIRPAFAVQIVYQGATVETAVDRVVYELVEKINTIPGVDDVYTEVTDGAKINTTIIFEVGYDAIKAKLDLMSQLEQHSYLARGNIGQPLIMEINPETIPVLQLVFGSTDLTVPELRKKVVEVNHRLGNIDGVSEMSIFGGYQESLVVEVDPVLLASHNLSITEVSSALQTSQGRMVNTGLQNGDYTTELVFEGRSATPIEIGLLGVADGVQIRDVAKVYQGSTGKRPYVYYQDHEKFGEVVMLSVAKVEGSSAPVVTKEFLVALDKILTEKEFSSLQYKVVSDDGVTASNEIYGLTSNLISSIAIVAVVLLVFLSVRSALVVLVAIPVTLLIVFGLGWFFDQTINRITLFALILSLGLLVDSAIVVVENIYSHLKEAHIQKRTISREKIISMAVGEIGVGLILSTLTSVIVFLPMNYITGMMGPYMGPIAFFVPAALIVSMLIAIIITPFVANFLIRENDEPLRITKWFSKVLEKVTLRYKTFLQTVLYSRKKQQFVLRGALGLFLISLLIPLLGFVHFQMLPRADRNQLYLYLDLPVGTSLEKTKEITNFLSDEILNDNNVVSVQQFVGTPAIVDFNGLFKGAQNRSGNEQSTLRINLVPSDNRDQSSSEIATKLRNALKTESASVADYVRLIEEPPGPPVQATLVAKVFSEDEKSRSDFTETLSGLIENVSGVVDVDTSKDESVGRVVFSYDEAAGANFGISAGQAQAVINLMGGPVELAEYLNDSSLEYTPLLLALNSQSRDAVNDVDGFRLKNTKGEMVPLSLIVDKKYEERPSKQSFEDSRATNYVTAEVSDRSVVYVVIEIMKQIIGGDLSGYKVSDWNLFGMTLESITGQIITLEWGGEWEMTLENFRDLGIAMGVALALVYAVLVAQYNRFATPAFILVTIPLGLIGILFGFFVLDNVWNINLTATALIGFIALIGLVVNNAIIFLEYVEQAELAGVEFRQALIAAGETRLRPIFLTSLTTILGSLTIAGDPVWSGLAWAIVFGLSLSTVMTLVIYPILLVYFDSRIKVN